MYWFDYGAQIAIESDFIAKCRINLIVNNALVRSLFCEGVRDKFVNKFCDLFNINNFALVITKIKLKRNDNASGTLSSFSL